MKLLGSLVLGWLLATNMAWAVPTRDEVYRSDRLKMIVYKDSQDPGVFWYTPPLRLYENEGKVVTYKRVKDDKANYYFYVVPYMTDDLIDLLAGEIPGLANKTQLKPVMATRFGITVKQFDVVAMGDQVTDYQYLNQPQLVRVALPVKDADEFDFFINNKPGVQANVLIHFDSERMDKYVNLELSHKEVYNALNIGATGQYKFTRAQIEANISNYVSKKYYYVKSKGDLPIPEIVNKALEECFTPYKRPEKKKEKNYKDWEDWLIDSFDGEERTQIANEVDANAQLLEGILADATSMTGGSVLPGDGWDPTGDNGAPWDDSGKDPKKPTGGTGGGGGDTGSLEFVFKKELANSDKSFFFKQEHYVDSSEIVAMPIYLSTQPSNATTKVAITPTQKKDFVVEYTNEQTKPFSPGVTVAANEQYIINAVFAYSAKSPYNGGNGMSWYRWPSSWPDVNEELYYRVGTGPWTKVNGRTVIKTESIYKGELQFYLDRKHIWEKIPSDYKDPKMLGLVPAIFTYKTTYPQFNVVVTGRRVQLNQ